MISGRNISLLTIIGVAALLGAAIRTSIAQTPVENRILVKDFTFTPNTLAIKAGSTVTWANLDAEPHSVVSDTGLFRSGALDTKESFSFKFGQTGTFHFTCSLHPRNGRNHHR